MDNKYDLFDIDIIIPFRNGGSDRFQNLVTVTRYIEKNFINYHLIIVEDGERQTVITDSDVMTLIYKKNIGAFNKSYLCNLGFRASRKNIFCFYDADIIVNPETLSFCVSEMISNDIMHDALCPYLAVDNVKGKLRFDFDEILSYNYLDQVSKDNENVSRLYATNSSGVVVFRSSSFREIGGYNESFSGWGVEDDELVKRAGRLGLKWFNIPPATMYHLHHGSNDLNEQRYKTDAYQKNLSILNEIEQYSNDQFNDYLKNLRKENFNA